jgi:phosphatidylserine/phosphatidylglycerophosphate/cardiolipin synthase-like enzyme
MQLGRVPASWLGLTLSLALGGCGIGSAHRVGGPATAPPLPTGIRVAFNHHAGSRYRSPVSGNWRQGDDLEAMLLVAIGEARQELLVAVQDLALPRVAEALVRRHRHGVRVRVVLENTYATPWSRQHPADLTPRQRHRRDQLMALGLGDAVAILERGGVPLIDDTEDGSAGSGLMHHKFLVVDRRVVVTGSANFTPSGIHGDPDDPRSRGNVNHLLRFESAALAGLFAAEFARLWGDGPGGATDSRFGLGKAGGGSQRVNVAGTPVEVLFTPHRRSDPRHGLAWLEQRLTGAERSVDLCLFVFSAQNLADVLAGIRARGVRIRLLADPGFANRAFSEVLDLLGVTLPDHRCRIEAGNRAWEEPLEGVGTPRLAGGDKLHHKFAVIDDRLVISGSFNWSPAAAHQNDETLLAIDSPRLARHFKAEMDRLWRGAELGVTPRLRRRMERRRRSCGRGRPREGPGNSAAAPTSTIKSGS